MNTPFSPLRLCREASDSLLVQQSLQGNRQAFDYLVERYSPLLTGYIASWCPDPDLVPDMVQGTLLQLYLCLPVFGPNQSLRAWLLRVAYRLCMSERRRKKPLLFSQLEQVSGEEDSSWFATFADPDPLPEDQAEQQERQSQILQAMQALPVRPRIALWLKYMDQLSYAEIARRLNIPEGTAKTNVARAKPLLRRLLAEEVSPANFSPRVVWKGAK